VLPIMQANKLTLEPGGGQGARMMAS